jgi:hypothetical protein
MVLSLKLKLFWGARDGLRRLEASLGRGGKKKKAERQHGARPSVFSDQLVEEGKGPPSLENRRAFFSWTRF